MTDAVTRSYCSLPIRGLGHLIVALFLLYPPNVLKDEFCELLLYGVLRSSPCGGPAPSDAIGLTPPARAEGGPPWA
jgi:hypothetical protein